MPFLRGINLGPPFELICFGRDDQRPSRPDEKWQTDIKYIRVGAKNYYLLSFMDVYSRYIVHHELLTWMDGQSVSVEAAAAIAIHHHPPFGSDPFDAFRFTFRLGAGVYLGVIFIFRGYGPAAGTHIAYNVLVVSLFA